MSDILQNWAPHVQPQVPSLVAANCVRVVKVYRAVIMSPSGHVNWFLAFNKADVGLRDRAFKSGYAVLFEEPRIVGNNAPIALETGPPAAPATDRLCSPQNSPSGSVTVVAGVIGVTKPHKCQRGQKRSDHDHLSGFQFIALHRSPKMRSRVNQPCSNREQWPGNLRPNQ